MTTNTGFAARQSAKGYFLGGLALMLGFSKGESCVERAVWRGKVGYQANLIPFINGILEDF